MSCNHPATFAPFLRVCVCILLLLPIVFAPSRAQDVDDLGGDDILITTSSDFTGYSPSMDIDEHGDIYAAVTVTISGNPGVEVYRSENGGDTWTLWGTVAAAGASIDFPCLHVAQGSRDRIYLAYRLRGLLTPDAQIGVAWSSLSGSAAAWNHRTVLSQANVDFQSPSLHSDEMSNANYAVYLAAMGSGVDGADVWFSRSSDYGDTWQDEYQIFSSTTGDGLFYPEIRYGRNGVVHCVCYYNPTATPTHDMSVLYRRATGYAASSANWQSVVALTSNADGNDEFHVSVAASHASDDVMIAYANRGSDGIPQPAVARYSSDAGATWKPDDSGEIPTENFPHVLVQPGTERVAAWGNPAGFDNFGFSWARPEDLGLWSVFHSIVDHNYTNVPNTQTGGQYFDYDASRSNRMGCVWMVYDPTGPDSLFFDAEWRRDPGYPNLEAGFPVFFDGLATSPPALCQLDGDAEMEIVCGTDDGNVHVYNHDGTQLAGWPIDVGELNLGMAIAVGDIDGDGENEVVTGNKVGVVFAFDANGTPLSGWPRNLGTNALAFVAIGGVTTAEQQVVVCCGTRTFLLRGDGTVVAPFPRVTEFSVNEAPALGDLDGDGDLEIVVTFWHYVQAFTGNGAVLFSRDIGIENGVSGPPTLADLDLDGDLEIAVPTALGILYVLEADGSDHPGWPFHAPGAETLTSAAFANITGGLEPELVFGSREPTVVYALDADGFALPGFPRPMSLGGNPLIGAPTVDVLAEEGPDVIHAGENGQGYVWTHQGASLPGWPHTLPGACLVSPATGDLDGDGRVEFVCFTSSATSIAAYDLGADLYRDPATPLNWWPMFGYDPERRGCLACPDTPGDVPELGAITRADFQLLPNPGVGAIRLHLELATPAAVRFDVFDSGGRLLRHIVKAEMAAGLHDLSWDGRDDDGHLLDAGTYFVRMRVNETETDYRKCVLLR